MASLARARAGPEDRQQSWLCEVRGLEARAAEHHAERGWPPAVFSCNVEIPRSERSGLYEQRFGNS